MNPYLTDRDMIERILAAARRGVARAPRRLRDLEQRAGHAALQHRYDDLIAAGVEIWELPGTVVHAKVVVADDVVSFGTVNLDAWALYRNSEIAMIARSAGRRRCSRSGCSSPTSPRSKRGEPPSGLGERLRELALGQADVRPLSIRPRTGQGESRFRDERRHRRARAARWSCC